MKYIEYILTSEEMQQYDRNTAEYFQIPELLLMEQAAMTATDEIVSMFPERNRKILILAGKGNNGGDAMAVARLLEQKGYKTRVCIVSNREIRREDFSRLAGIQYDILKRMNISIVTELPTDSYDIVIDGIFGVGLNREISGNAEKIINFVNEVEGYKISLDIPSGICGTSGKVLGTAFRADCTITFAFLKRGLCLYPGAVYAGKIIKKEIGITKDSFLGRTPQMYALMGKVKEYLPVRNPAGHKGTFGKVLLVAGNKDMGGAAMLAGKAAMRSGCGMLRICTHKNQKTGILTMLPEAIVDVYETKEEAVDCVLKGIRWADIIAMGPGMGTEDTSKALLNTVLQYSSKSLVLDADALNLLSIPENLCYIKNKQRTEEGRRKLVLTPHPLELGRLLGKDKETIQNNGLELTNQLAEELHCTIVKKDARTIVCNGGNSFILNLCGNSGMATAGSGDVLTGIIASMLAVCSDTFEAAAIGVYIHGKAGDYVKEWNNEYSLVAGDLCQALTEVLK